MALEFQAYKWELDEGESANRRETHLQDKPRATTIYIYGLTEENKTVCIKVPDFKPWVYLELDPKIKWTKGRLEILYTYLKKRLNRNAPVRKKFYRKTKAYFSKKADFVWMTFDTIFAIRDLEKVCRNKLTIFGIGSAIKLTVHEQKADPILKLLATQQILPTGWISIETENNEEEESENLDRFSTTDIQKIVSYKKLKKIDSTKVTNPKVMSYDIECISGDKTGMTFPNANRKSDKVIVISATIGRYLDPESEWKNYSLVNAEGDRKCPKIEDCKIKNFKNETALLLGWKKFILDQDPDIIISYNGLTFDDKYLADRSSVLLCWPIFSVLGRAVEKRAQLKERRWNSSAYGDQLFNYLDIPGRLHIDMLPTISKEYQSLSSYTLNSVSEHFLNEHKIDLPAREMIQIYHFGGSLSMKKIVEYCNKDTVLPFRLMKHLNSWIGLAEASNTMKVPVFDLITRGQQIRVFSQILFYTIYRDIVCNDKWTDYKPTDLDKKVMGATVQNPKVGLWEYVFTFDFKSLYPTTIIAYNLCFSTFVPENVFPPEEDYHTIKVNSHQGCEHDTAERKSKLAKDKIICKEETFRFYKAHIIKGIIPAIAENLLDARDATKKQLKKLIKENGDKVHIQVLDKRQNSLKVSANSMYGSFITDYANLPFYPAGAATTAIGRHSIQQAIDYMLEKRQDAEVIYGDSVTEDTPILCRLNGKVFYRTIDDLPLETETPILDHGKEFFVPKEGLETWSDKGFTKIKKIIRHKTDKEVFRVLTHTGVVDVTEDHSLLNENAEKITPNEIKVGQKLLSKDLPTIGNDQVLKAPFSKGLFYGDGSCGGYNCPSGIKYSWAINNSNKNLLEKSKIELQKFYPDYDFKILETMKSSNVYKLVCIGKVKQFVEEWRQLFYDKNSYKKIPDEVFSSDLESRDLFFKGYYEADGDKDKNGYTRMDNKGKIGSAGLYILANSLGYLVSINTRNDKQLIYRLTCSKKQRKEKDTIKKIISLGKTEHFVYDLETENHHFGAGIGRLIVHNTDSCMMHFRQIKDIKSSFDLAYEIEKEINKLFPPPMFLEFEKVYIIYLLLKKKNYLGEYLETLDGKINYDKKGVVSKRRDNCQLLRDTYTDLIELVMTKQPKWKTFEYLYNIVDKILKKEIQTDKLVITKSIKENYKATNLPHLAVAEKMRSRGKYVVSGTRVPYLFIDTGEKNAPQYKIAEDPDYYLENKDKIDINWVYYLEKQLATPVDEVLEIIYGSEKVITNLVKLIKKGVDFDLKDYFLPRFEIVE